MKDKLEPNMYVRTKWGIAKYIHNLVTKETVYRVIDKKIIYDNVEDWEDCLLDNEILKASHNIIDILEIGDYVNGYYVEDVLKTFVNVAVGSNYFQSPTIYEKDIKSIVTKEQFESMSYRIGE